MTGFADVVVVAINRLEETTVRHVAAACDRLRTRYVPWTGEGALQVSAPPMMLIAGLPSGERQVPRDLMQLCSTTYPGTPLLLLCQEGLVSPTVTLQDGQVILVGPPLTANRIYGRIAIIRAERRGDSAQSTLSPTEDSETGLWTRERLHDDIWAAGIGCRGLSRGPSYRPLLKNTIEGLTALMPERPESPFDEGHTRRVLETMRTPMSAAARRDALEANHSGLCVAHFDRRAEEWVFFWPRREFPLWMCSQQRLPRSWDLAEALRNDVFLVMKAYCGDMVVGMSGSAPEGPDGEEPSELAAAISHGGHAVLSLLENRLIAAPRSFAGVLLEVRG